ncbi:GAF domain-containing protein [Pelosinus sp. sgz500959]|uniref:GAF domain-containing protein n=1 Tax=Pelosinus sp. sgz500959 TaxID=3242472 RepID=UPI00366EEC93
MSDISHVVASTLPPGVNFHDLSGGGETGRLILAKNWSNTALGPIDSWPKILKNYLQMILELPTAAIIFWGEDHMQIYNDGYAQIMGSLHPGNLGATFQQCWPNEYETIHPWMHRVLDNGETVKVEKMLIPLFRHGFTNEAYFTFSFTPLRDDHGVIVGVLQLVTEVTDTVLCERRISCLYDLAATKTAHIRDVEKVLRSTSNVLSRYNSEMPIFALYMRNFQDQMKLVRIGRSEVRSLLPLEIDLRSAGNGLISKIAEAIQEQKVISSSDSIHTIHSRARQNTRRSVVILPITSPDVRSAAGVLVVETNPHLKFDHRYQSFLELIIEQISTMLRAAQDHKYEKRWTEELSMLKRDEEELAAIQCLYRISTLPISADSLIEISNIILETAIDLAGADMGTFQLLDAESDVLKITAQLGFKQPFLDFFATVHAGCGAACGAALAERNRVFVENVSESPIFVGTPALEVLLTAGVRAVQSTPLISRSGRLVGMIATHYREKVERGKFDLTYIDLLCGQAADIIEQVQAEKALLESEKKYRQLFEMMNEGFALIEMIFDDDGQPVDYLMLEINPAWERHAGMIRQQVIGRRMTELLPEVEAVWLKRYGEVVTSGKANRFEEYNVSLDRWFEVFAYPLYKGNRFAVILSDITERRRVEAEMQRLDRLNIVGEMSAAIGHEIRNPMTTVRGYLQFLQRKTEEGSNQYGIFDTMIEELDRANLIISEFLSLAKDKAIELASGNLNNVINKLQPLLQAEALRIGHELIIELGEVPDVMIDEREIRQMILNFICNGFEAMKIGGRLTITTYAQKEWVMVSIRDTGPGIPPMVMNKLGVPFTTTKESGTGLGLSVCYRIAQRHKAFIDVKTSSLGTVFTVFFPMVDLNNNG